MPYAYFAFGLCILSDIALPELGDVAKISDPASPCVTVRVARVAATLAQARRRDTWIEIGDRETLVTIPGVARYLVRDGREIVIDPQMGDLQDAPWPMIRAYLLGSVLGVLCHERGLMPLHANAIAVNGRAVLFAGHSGAGKSTLAAAFQDKGYDVLCDDVCVVSFAGNRHPLAWPGIPRVRMWRDTAEALGKDVAQLEPAACGMAKYHLPLRPALPRHGLKLAAVYVLQEAKAQNTITRLCGAQALAAVMAQTYRHHYLEMAGATAAQFGRNTQLLAYVPVFGVPWRKNFATLAADAAKLEQHFLNHMTADLSAA